MIKKRLFSIVSAIVVLCIIIPFALSGCGSDGPAKEGDKVSVHYTLILEDGTVYETSVGTTPLEFVIGSGQVLEKFEQAVIGLKTGESITVDIEAVDAYGEYRDDLIFDVSKDQLEEGYEPQVGDTVYWQDTAGYIYSLVVLAVSENGITVDANSALAGQDLTFEIELLKIV